MSCLVSCGKGSAPSTHAVFNASCDDGNRHRRHQTNQWRVLGSSEVRSCSVTNVASKRNLNIFIGHYRAVKRLQQIRRHNDRET